MGDPVAKLEPLEVADDDSYVAQVFGSGGMLAAKLPGYQVRVGQLELAYSVDAAMRASGGMTVLVEAPTGTGKSIGYGVPAARFAQLGQRTVIVTANIALQEQLVTKDLPLMQAATGFRFGFALAKGINNYLCLDAFEESEGDLLLRGGPRAVGAAAWSQWEAIRTWSATTSTGDVSELAFEPLQEIRRRFTTTSDDCVGKACPEHDRCFAMRAREEARRAEVVVTNYHLFFADLAVKLSTESAKGILAPYQHVVLDEGHEAAGIARGFFGFRVTRGSVRWASRLLGGARGSQRRRELGEVNAELRRRVNAAADRLFSQLRGLHDSSRYEARLRDPGAFDAGDLPDALRDAEQALAKAASTPGLPPDRREEVRRAANRCGEIATSVEAARDLGDEERLVYYLEPAGDDLAALCMLPLDVSPTLRGGLFEAERLGAKVVTSATLSAGGKNGFALVAGELGAERSEQIVVESPFDHARQSVLVIPRDLPLPIGKEAAAFPEAVAELLVRVLGMSGGRLLGLFTSYRALDVAARRLERERLPFRVMRQGDAPRTQLIWEFREDERSVLLGTASFWQGVDVPGRSLSVVFVDKLPFDPPTDPVMSALADRDKRAFKKYMLPRACIALKQGVGRLIRTTDDRGAAVVCDRRLVEKPYGRAFLRALPEMPMARDLEVIREYV
jgi:ATP-dependent DNA helicase DinG